MPLLLRTHYKLARTAIKEHRTRSFLTCLGIAIGVASIILILSLMGSISNLVKSEISDLGNDLMVVRPNSTKDTVTDIIDELTTSNSFQKSTLSISDVSTIAKTAKIALWLGLELWVERPAGKWQGDDPAFSPICGNSVQGTKVNTSFT